MPAIGGRDGALRLQFRQLPLQRGRDLLRAIVRARSAQLPGIVLFVRRSIDSTTAPPSRVPLIESVICASALSIRNAGGTQPGAARRLHPAELAVELLRVGLQPREIRLGVGGVVDAMVAVQEARDVEIGADVLNDDVGRVAPAADRDVAVRQREAFERRGIGAAHDLDAGAHGVRQAARS